ncbi:MAG TPA: DUF5777 family beta-barrel protein [Chitinophagaceae bacterium]|jgi:hypothetical protein|nr:DUF5777 family beta-barrel protein [Chitinophagaceae bacterium]
MKIACMLACLLISFYAFSQEEMTTKEKGKRVEIFTSDKAINATTTTLVGKGKMDFNVVHHFGDIAGKQGGLSNFFGLDNATDFRIGFEVGLSDRLDMSIARYRGSSVQQKLMELNLKYLVAEQRENDPSHPVSILLFANVVTACSKSSHIPNTENYFEDFGSRTSNAFALVIARKMGKVSLQLNPTLVTRGYAISYDQKTIFALGGAIRFPVSPNMNIIVDYFHPFRSEASKDSFAVKPATAIKFSDPLGIGLEIIKGRHAFHLNFTNSAEIVENRFIPRTVHSWGKGQFRWGFTISRQFTVWKPKGNKQ